VYLSDSADYIRWKDGVIGAWNSLAHRFPGKAHSLYFGGGTPSLAPAEIIGQLIEELPLKPNAEITLEANPGTIDMDGLSEMRHAGINRLSIGVQTFNQNHARMLGRGHNVHQARNLLESANSLEFTSWSMDLMFSLPNQSVEELQNDLDELLRFDPPHVSLYGLSIEPGTPFKTIHDAGNLVLPNPEQWRQMYDDIVRGLEDVGMERYEVSNFAQPGHRAVHNEQVWRGGFYAGLGPGAHGFPPDGIRTLGKRDINDWYADPIPVKITTDQRDAAIDYLLSSLRHIDGTSQRILRERTGHELSKSDLDALVMKSMLTEGNEHVRLTHSAFPLADGILRKLIEGLQLSQST